MTTYDEPTEIQRAKDRNRAIREAQRINKHGFAIIDTETTGFKGPDCEIVQFAILQGWQHSPPKLRWHDCVMPIKLITPGAFKTHGWSTDKLASHGALSIRDHYNRLHKWLAYQECVAYNVDFDSFALENTFLIHELEIPPQTKWTCAMLLYAQYRGEWNYRHGNYKWAKLHEAAAEFGYEFNAHDAMADVEATAAVLLGMGKQPLTDLSQFK